MQSATCDETIVDDTYVWDACENYEELNRYLASLKLYDSFPIEKFLIDCLTTPCIFDRNKKEGFFLLCLRKDIPSKDVSNIILR